MVSKKCPLSAQELGYRTQALSIVANELQNVFLNCFSHCILAMLTTLVHCCGLFVATIQRNKQIKELEDKRHNNLLFHNSSTSLPLLLLMKKASKSYCMDFEEGLQTSH